MKTPLEVIVAIQALFADRSHWTQGGFARDRAGYKVSPTDPDAVRWCVDGAVRKFTEPHDIPLSFSTRAMLDDVAFDLDSTFNSVSINDQLGYDAVMNLLERTAERLRETEIAS